MARALKSTERKDLAGLLQLLADELTRPQADQTMRAIGDDYTGAPFPKRTSGAPAQPHNQVDDDGHPLPPDTLTEAKALTPDREGVRARMLLEDIWTIYRLIKRTLPDLKGRRPDRLIPTCPNCGNTLPSPLARCQRMIDGARCGSATTRRCIDCSKECEPKRWVNGRCDSCRIKLGRDRAKPLDTAGLASVDRLHLGGNVEISDTGGAHA